MSRPRAIALLERTPDEVFACYGGRDVSVNTFLTHVDALRAVLPSESHIFNLLSDRYEFTVAFAAIVAEGKCNVLPSSPGRQRWHGWRNSFHPSLLFTTIMNCLRAGTPWPFPVLPVPGKAPGCPNLMSTRSRR